MIVLEAVCSLQSEEGGGTIRGMVLEHPEAGGKV